MEKALAELEAIQEAQKKAALPALEIEPLTQEKVDFDTFCKIRLPRRQGQGLRSCEKER